MTDVVIEINKGMVTGVYSDTDFRFVVVDWDLQQRLEPGVTIASIVDGETMRELPDSTLAEYKKVAG